MRNGKGKPVRKRIFGVSLKKGDRYLLLASSNGTVQVTIINDRTGEYRTYTHGSRRNETGGWTTRPRRHLPAPAREPSRRRPHSSNSPKDRNFHFETQFPS